MPSLAARRSPWLVFAGAWILLSVLATLWSLATPLSAAPDEPAHMVKAASVIRGQFIGVPDREGSAVDVPQYIAFTHGQTCYAMNDEVTANCIPAVPGDPAEIVGSATTAGLYNPVYYLLTGWPTLVFQDSTGVFALRIVSGIIASLFLALTAMMITTWRRPAMPILGLAAAITPMVLFLDGAVNPNSVEITATLAAFTAVLGVIREPNPALLTQRSVILMVSAAIAANMRGLSPLWLAVAILAPFVLSSKQQIVELLRTVPVRVAIIVVLSAVSFAIIWLRASNSLSPALDLPASERPLVPYQGASPVFGFFAMLAQTGGNLNQMIGVFGWLDTAARPEVYMIWVLFIGVLLLAGFVLLRARALVFIGILVGATLLLPALVQAAFITNGGWIWQGRYALPLLVLALVGISAMLADRFELLSARTARLLIGTAAVLWSGAQVLAFVSALHRYAVGESGSWSGMILEPLWSPPLGIVPTIALFAVVAALTGYVGYRVARRSAPELEPAG